MPTAKTTEGKVASAKFTTTWEEAIAFQQSLHMLRRELREIYGIDNLQMHFGKPWGGPSHTEFSLSIEMAKGATAASAKAFSRWLLSWGKNYLKNYRKTPKSAATKKRIGRPPETFSPEKENPAPNVAQ